MEVLKIIDNVRQMLEEVDALTKLEVLVGVPAQNSTRDDTKMTNAAIAYVHEFGSPVHNIPARPFLRPGVKNAKEDIRKKMLQGAKEALAGKPDAAQKTLNAVGMIGRNSVVRAITNPSPAFVPLKYATIRARLRRRGGAGRRKLQKFDKLKAAAGWTRAEAAEAMRIWGTDEGNIRPLLDSLRLRNSITYVIRPAAKQRTGTRFGYQPDYGKIVLGYK